VYQFRIEIDGLNQFEAQEINLPEQEREVVEHGDTDRKVKTLGMWKVGDITLKKLRPADSVKEWAWDWLNSGEGRIIVISALDDNGATVNAWTIYNTRCKKTSFENFSRTSSDNMMETVVLCCDRVEPRV
jgi:phage tail-like protein